MRAVATILCCAAMLPIGCSSSAEAPHGSPFLMAVYWKTPGQRTPVWLRDPDAATATRVPGYATEIDFVFDRRLDGSKIEDTVGNATVPKPVPPISVSWPGIDDPVAPVMSEPRFSHQVFYNSTAAFGGQSSYAFLRPVVPGFPSSTTVTLSFDKSAFTSAYGEVMDGPDQIAVEIDVMTIAPRRPATADALETLPPAYTFPIGFSSRPAPIDRLSPFARARADGVPIPVALTGDTVDKTAVFVSAAACLGGWPMGARIDISFAAGVPDAFGVATTTEMPAGSFFVTGSPEARDAGCD